MNVWTSSSRLATSSRQVGRFLVGECSSTRVATSLRSFSIRSKALYSTDAVPEENPAQPSPKELLQSSGKDTLSSRPPKPEIHSTHDASHKSKGKSNEYKSEAHTPASAASTEEASPRKFDAKTIRERRKIRRLRKKKAVAARKASDGSSEKEGIPEGKLRASKKTITKVSFTCC